MVPRGGADPRCGRHMLLTLLDTKDAHSPGLFRIITDSKVRWCCTCVDLPLPEVPADARVLTSGRT